jgi:hypothetical protein
MDTQDRIIDNLPVSNRPMTKDIQLLDSDDQRLYNMLSRLRDFRT